MKQSFSYSKTLVVGFGFLGISIIWPIFNQFIPIFLQAGNPEFERQLIEAGRAVPDVVGFGLTPALALFIMTWDNIINVFLQPWVGARSDRTRNRFGRRKGWILIGVPIAAAGFVFIPLAQTLLAMAAFILITNLGMALFRSPTVAWLGDLFPNEDRSKANGIINLMGGVGSLLAFFGGGALFNALGRPAPFIFGAIVLVIASAIAVIFVKEPENLGNKVKQEKGDSVLKSLKTVITNPDKGGLLVLLAILFWFMGYNALDSGLSSFAVFTLGIAPGTASIAAGSITIAFILSAVPAGLLGTKYGRKRVIAIGLVGLTVLALAGFIAIQNIITFIIVLMLMGFAWAMVNVNSLPLVYDHGDESKIGAYTGLYYFSSQTAAILGPTLGGITVEALGSEYRWLWLFAMVFMALAWITITRVRDRIQVA